MILPPGIEPHGASILPHREDGASYAGVLTFTATKPVEIGFSHRPHVDDSTLSQLDAETLDDLLTVHQTNRGEKGLPGVIAVPVCYYPRLWNSTTIFLCVSSFRSQFDMA